MCSCAARRRSGERESEHREHDAQPEWQERIVHGRSVSRRLTQRNRADGCARLFLSPATPASAGSRRLLANGDSERPGPLDRATGGRLRPGGGGLGGTTKRATDRVIWEAPDGGRGTTKTTASPCSPMGWRMAHSERQVPVVTASRPGPHACRDKHKQHRPANQQARGDQRRPTGDRIAHQYDRQHNGEREQREGDYLKPYSSEVAPRVTRVLAG